MSETLIDALDLIAPGDLVLYHGSITDHHGLYIVTLCQCTPCRFDDRRGAADARYRLINPWDSECALHHVRRESITRSAVCG
ncbi:hypothetical protein [Streptomyces scopuliridis]|uniref:hypothetical protein n=1 Tax=Streptomyces scopuliridis TaxID=452529 RepID=UPI003439CDC9